MSRSYSRRDFIQGLAAFSGAAAGASALLSTEALAQQAADPRFLIVLTGAGGASIIDGPLAIKRSECAAPERLNVFEDADVRQWDDSPFRAADLEGSSIGLIPAAYRTRPSEFLAAHRQDLLVSTWRRTSVNHDIGQRRSVTGNEAWRGRTMQEIVAWQYGADAAIPNVHLVAGSGYNEPGTDGTVPPWARGNIVANPTTFPLSLDGSRGTKRPMEPELLAAIRAQRNEAFEPESRFDQVFGQHRRIVQWKDLRGTTQERIEGLDLITKLMLFTDNPQVPLTANGLSSSPLASAVLSVFPNLGSDPLEAQAALAFLLIKYGVSVTVTLGPTFDLVFGEGEGDGGATLPINSIRNPPLAFDVSHQGHRSGQSVMWDRLYKVMDGLIALLQAEDFGDGTSYWDRTMIYVGSDFGREKNRPPNATDWGTSHHLNNGVAMCSPLVNGNTLLGGVDPDTGLTYGYDVRTGVPDPGRDTEEAEVFSGVLTALDIDTSGSGLPDVPVFKAP